MTLGSRRTAAATTSAPPDRRYRGPTGGRARVRFTSARLLVCVPTVLTVITLSVIILSAQPRAVLAQTDEPDRPSVEILDQTTYVAADGTFSADLALQPGPGPVDDLVLSITVFGLIDDPAGVGGNDAFAQPLNRRAAISIGDLPMIGEGRYRLDIPIRPGADFDELDRTLVPFAGVYPLSIELRNTEGPVAADRTYLVRLPPDPDPDADPDPDPEPGTEPETEPETEVVRSPPDLGVMLSIGGSDLTVAQATGLAAAHPELPLTVLLSPDALSILRADRTAAADLAGALAGRVVVAKPTLDLDPSALAEIDHGHLYHQTLRGLETELTGMGLQTDPTVAVLDAPLTEAGIDVLVTAGITRVIDPATRSGPTRIYRTAGATDGGRLTVIGFDPDPTDVLRRHGAPAALARLSFRSADDPVTVIGPGVGPDAADALDRLLTGLAEPGAPSPVDPLNPDPTTSTDTIAKPVERPQQDLTTINDLLTDVERLLATYETFHDGGGTEPAAHRQVILAGLSRTRHPEDRLETLEAIRGSLVDDLGVIGLPDGQPLTLAARSATIPVIVESRAAGPRKVMLRFRSDKVTATDDGRIVTVEPGTSSIDVELETRSLGASPLSVAVMTPDGETTLASSQFEIRSTAVPGLGLLVSVGALCCLLAWWAIDARKRRQTSVESGRGGGDLGG